MKLQTLKKILTIVCLSTYIAQAAQLTSITQPMVNSFLTQVPYCANLSMALSQKMPALVKSPHELRTITTPFIKSLLTSGQSAETYIVDNSVVDHEDKFMNGFTLGKVNPLAFFHEVLDDKKDKHNLLDGTLGTQANQQIDVQLPKVLSEIYDHSAGRLVLSPKDSFTPIHIDAGNTWMTLTDGEKNCLLFDKKDMESIQAIHGISNTEARLLSYVELEKLGSDYQKNNPQSTLYQANLQRGDFLMLQEKYYHAVHTTKASVGISGKW